MINYNEPNIPYGRYDIFKHVRQPRLGTHEFFVAKVKWDWRRKYYTSGQFGNWSLDEKNACAKWLKENQPDVYEWLIEYEIDFYVKSTGDSWQRPKNYKGNGVFASSWTVACIEIRNNDSAALFKLKWC